MLECFLLLDNIGLTDSGQSEDSEEEDPDTNPQTTIGKCTETYKHQII